MEDQMKQMLDMMTAMSAQQKAMEEKVSRMEDEKNLSNTPKATSLEEPQATVLDPARGASGRVDGPKVDPPPKFAGKEEEWRMFSLEMRSFYGNYLRRGSDGRLDGYHQRAQRAGMPNRNSRAGS